ncbi:hypothetical protein GCM10025875_14970 [Litorihabitans aurantiacus]|uniref:Uncharacterized protein n=1 Tax=Litorihabitans aurantiacus TaxID=1930061 RepID=A0AA37XE83_9MICO|nr:hypothetical protein GCM10025875_14970 [Litorihabitans aurantiacus]
MQGRECAGDVVQDPQRGRGVEAVGTPDQLAQRGPDGEVGHDDATPVDVVEAVDAFEARVRPAGQRLDPMHRAAPVPRALRQWTDGDERTRGRARRRTPAVGPAGPQPEARGCGPATIREAVSESSHPTITP